MKIVFDARCINPEASGASVYVRELLRRLPALAPDWSWHTLFHDEATRDAVLGDALPGGLPNVSSDILPYRFYNLSGKARLMALLRRVGCDLYFSPIVANSFLARLGFRGLCRAAVVTIHSNPMRDTVKTWNVFRKRLCLSQAVHHCTAAIVTTETLRGEIIGHFGLKDDAANRLKTVFNGVSPAFSPAPAPPQGDANRVILYVGNHRKYKNIPVLIRAFEKLRHRLGGLHLLLIGPESDDPRPLRDLIHDLGLNSHVTLAGEVTEAELVSAYRESALFVSPSEYEAFSLPIMSAMASGTPVVCCDGGSVRELVGDVADPLPPLDQQALEVAMEAMLTDDALRARTIKAGLARAAEFSWDRTARETLKVFTDALAENDGGAR